MVGLELGLWMECKGWLKLIDSGGGYLAEDDVGDVMYIFGLSLAFGLKSEKRSAGNGGTGTYQVSEKLNAEIKPTHHFQGSLFEQPPRVCLRH